ncbi:uncharacterized protein EV420DRAFT_1513561 [Desarmillaria tabescens]|uniref:BZIP domain-containing protein n=1 Tax=Armillaria tabescens TaxID=1929756 RepID=A0AA39T535_ARMTA|nr:uncharacterized protein EV420DRAFT_1513561 [Desarmillaria tabescens]KAK0465251.1 hypothetical protein EV420DRAFT_1513561 [Desarmillaria tabescens]
MLFSLKSPVSDASDSSSALDSIQTELDRWKNLIFSFDMDEKNSGSSSDPSSSNPQRSRSPPGASGSRDNNTRDLQDAVLLAQFAASSNSHQVNGPLDPSVVALLQALQVVQGQRYPPPNLQGSLPPGIPLHLLGALQQSQAQQFPNVPWPQQQSPSSGGLFPNQNPSAGFPPHMLPYFYDQMSQSNYYHVPPPQGTPTQSAASSSTATRPAASPPDTDSLEGGADDKRKRNTAASARFRIKKKQKTLNLERSVSDLTGRAEELEKEAADLRRENGWLKEIVMLKGSRLAGVHLTPDTVSSSMWDHGQAATLSPSGDKPSAEEKDGDSDSNDDSSDSEYTGEGRVKGKGKGKGKARKR